MDRSQAAAAANITLKRKRTHSPSSRRVTAKLLTRDEMRAARQVNHKQYLRQQCIKSQNRFIYSPVVGTRMPPQLIQIGQADAACLKAIQEDMRQVGCRVTTTEQGELCLDFEDEDIPAAPRA